MAFKQATFTCTADANGLAEDDVRLHIPSSPTRPCYVESLTFDDSAATHQALNVSLFEVTTDDDDIEIEGPQLFIIPDPGYDVISPRVASVDDTGTALTGEGGRIRINSQNVRCRVEGGVSGDVFTVVFEYETGGDYRF